MLTTAQVAIPTLVRIKPGALDRLGIYAQRERLQRVACLYSEGLDAALRDRAMSSLQTAGVKVAPVIAIRASDLETAERLARELPAGLSALIGLGGGKALDVAKYTAFRAGLPYLAVPTSLSNDGFSSHQSSLLVEGRRRSQPAAIPAGVIVDTLVCQQAPLLLWQSGVGDLAAKITAVRDWKLAYRAVGTVVNDFAALLSLSTVYQFMARPERDLEGVRVLATALMLSGIAMEIAGSSRPASGSEHLISHALDQISARPRLHGLQVGVAAYLVGLWQGENTAGIARLFAATGFWDAVCADPFDRKEWLEALRAATTLKTGFYTILSTRDFSQDLQDAIRTDEHLRGCFV